MTNIILALDGDWSASEAYHMALPGLSGDSQLYDITVRDRHLDQWSKREGCWGLHHQATVRDFDDIRPVVPLSSARGGRRNLDDPSFAVLNVAKPRG
ncbi:MAG: hypothetical protein ABIO85_06535 [Sphingomicrobium sp.]